MSFIQGNIKVNVGLDEAAAGNTGMRVCVRLYKRKGGRGRAALQSAGCPLLMAQLKFVR